MARRHRTAGRDVVVQGYHAPVHHTIAVLPFVDLEDQGSANTGRSTWFTRGFAEDLITELGRFAPLEVVHPYSSFQSADATSDRLLGEGLGARWLLRGSVRRDGERLLVTARLSEAQTGRSAWSERFEVPAREVPAVQIEIAGRVAGALAIELDRRQLSRARARPLADLEAYECWLRGLDELRQGTLESDESARAIFRRALEVDPHFARAHAGLSLAHFNEWSCQAWEAWDETERKAFEAARRALALDDSDPVIHLILGRIQLYRREFDAAQRHLDLALELNPNDADSLVQIALGKTYLGEASQALELMAKAKRLNPRHDDWYFAFEVYPAFLVKRYDEALRLAALGGPRTVDMAAFQAAAHAHLGQLAEARERLDAFLDVFRERITFGREPEPGEPLRWILHVNPHRDAADAEHLERGLRLAGLAPDPDASTLASAEPSRTRAVFRLEDRLWHAGFQGRGVRLQAVKGLADVAVLLGRPGEPVHCLELAGRTSPADRSDALLDPEGKRRLRERVGDLQSELDEAEAANDVARAEKARAELETLVDSLAGALGIGGRARPLGCGVEKARTAVTWRIRSALKKVAAVHPSLGKHLENSVRTGTWCSYEPEQPVAWEL